MDKLGINLGFFLFQLLNFLGLVVLLYAFAYRPILNMLETRKKKIAQGLEDAQVAAEARANAEKEAREIIAKAQAEANQKIREASERAEVAAKDILTQAEVDAGKAREAALAEVTLERDRILSDVRGQIAALAMAATQRLIGEALDERRQRALIDEFFSGVKSGKVSIVEGEEALAGGSIVVTSALPLTQPERDTFARELKVAEKDQSTMVFRVDPSILGGVIVRMGDKVVDGSVSGQLDALRQILR
jgi:F-type H+-transporting ATPase subunit b